MDVTALGVTAPSPPYIMPPGELFSCWKKSSLNSSYSLFSLSPHHSGLPALHIVPAFSLCSGEGMVGVYKEKGRLTVGECKKSRKLGRGAEQWLEAENPSQVPGRRRALWLPTAIAFISIFLIRDKKKLDLAETLILTIKMRFIWGIRPALLSEYQGFARCT